MSASFRPVREVWGQHSSRFIGHETLVGLFADLAARVSSSWRESQYDDLTVVWMSDGKVVLDYIERDERFNAKSFSDSLAENGYTVNEQDLGALISNMKSFAKSWRKSLHGDGSLRFYID